MTIAGYTYLLTDTATNKLYVGGRTNFKGAPEADTNYWSSSTVIKELRKQDPARFTKTILDTFATEGATWSAEHALLQDAKATPDLYYNENYGDYSHLTTPEVCAKRSAKCSASLTELNADPVFAEKRDITFAEVKKTAHYRKAHLEAIAKIHASPTYQANHKEAVKKLWADPVHQAKHNARIVRGKSHYKAVNWIITEPCGNVLILDVEQLTAYCIDTFGRNNRKTLQKLGKFGKIEFGKVWTCTKEQK